MKTIYLTIFFLMFKTAFTQELINIDVKKIDNQIVLSSVLNKQNSYKITSVYEKDSVKAKSIVKNKSKSDNVNFNLFECKDYPSKFFIASNSGIKATPIGLKFGLFCKTGIYTGFRFGQGELYNTFTNKTSNNILFSALLIKYR